MADGQYPNVIRTLFGSQRTDTRVVLSRYAEAQQIRTPYEADWKMNSAFCLPRHYSGWQSTGPIIGSPSTAVKRYAYDATGARALPKFAAILRRLATPDGHKWQRLTASDAYLRQQYRVRAYFDDLTDLLFKLRYAPKAMFSQSVDETYSGLGCYGTAPLRMKWRRRTVTDRGGGLGYKAMPLKDMFFLTNADGVIDTAFARQFMTAPQIKRFFPPGTAFPSAIAQEIAKPDGGSNTRHFEIVHAVFPREESRYDPDSITIDRHPWVGCFVSVEGAEYIGPEEGFRSFPYLVPRTATEPGELYGFSPAQQASPALGSVNAMKKSLLRLSQKAADPPLLASDDGVLSGKLGLSPGFVNYGAVNAAGNPLVHSLQTGNFQPAKEILADERSDINDAFLVTLFQILMETPEMTATEVIERVAEKAALAAPTMGRLQTGLLGPEVERGLDLIAENAPWLMPEMPPELIEAEGEYEIIYTSPLAKGLHAEEDSGFLWMVNTSLEIATATGDSSILDHYNFDVAIPELAEHRSVPARWMNTDEQVADIREGRAKQAQQQQLAEAAPAIASIAATSMKANKAA